MRISKGSKNYTQSSKKNADVCRIMSAIEDALALVPIAVATAGGCWRIGRRIRPPSKIQKICVLLPDKCGKTHLARVLGASDKVLVDCGEFAKVFDKEELLPKLGDDRTLADAVSDGLLDDVYEYVRKLVKRSKKKTAIFLTSNVEWAMKKFKSDAVYALVPSCEFASTIEGCEPSRSRLLHALPREAVKTFSSWEHLEGMLRVKFGIEEPV